MASAGHGLRIRYGLRLDPSQSQIDAWVQRTRELIRNGYSPEAAGDLAARELFPDYRTHAYASEAETIATLLEAAGKK